MPPTSIIVIGASTGGVDALRLLTSGLPRAFPAPILIVLHVGAYPSELPALLNAVSSITAKHAEDGEEMSGEQIYIAPPDRHMVVREGRLRLTRSPKENWARPAIDPLFRSAARAYGTNAIGVILTGNLNDGTEGLLEIKRHGGIAIVQDPADAINPAMPSSAAAHVALDFCLPLARIPQLLIELIDGREGKDLAMPIALSQHGEASDAIHPDRFDRPLTITCPECGGALRKSETGSVTKFGCHIGHAYTAEVMAMAQFDEMEKTLRSAVRCLNERAQFCRQMAEGSLSDSPASSADWEAAGKQALERAYELREFVERDWILPASDHRS